MSREFEKKLKKLELISTVPTVVLEILNALKNPNVKVGEAVELISIDQCITAKVLRVVNSPFYGFPRKISTIGEAIGILGFQAIRNMIITMSVFTAVSSGNNSDRDRLFFWRHSLACGVIAKIISDFLNIRNSDEMFICGLVHDIGKIVIKEHFPVEHKEMFLRFKRENKVSWRIEKDVLGCEHGKIGALIAQRWNFPDVVCESILNHHFPEKSERFNEAVYTVNLADALTFRENLGSLFNKTEEDVPRFSLHAFEVLGKKLRVFIDSKKFKETFRKEMESSEVFFSLINS